jgi:hypothetical protein
MMLWIRDVCLPYQGDECLIWPFQRLRGEYGTLGRQDKTLYAHRYICQIVNSDPPTPEHHAAHTCGRGHEACVTPRHLYWGTGTDNQIDRRKHGTSATIHGRWKLTETQVAEIKALQGTEPSQVVAKRFGVTESNIRKIWTGKTWKTGKRQVNGFDAKPWTAERRSEYGY